MLEIPVDFEWRLEYLKEISVKPLSVKHTIDFMEDMVKPENR